MPVQKEMSGNLLNAPRIIYPKAESDNVLV